jgi:hypothetical protein
VGVRVAVIVSVAVLEFVRVHGSKVVAGST